QYGKVFLTEIASYLQKNPRQIFADDSLSAPKETSARARLAPSANETLLRFRTGDSVETIASSRGLATSTILGHLVDAVTMGEAIDLGRFLKREERSEIEGAFKQIGLDTLTPVFEALSGRYDYDRLRLVRAAMLSGLGT